MKSQSSKNKTVKYSLCVIDASTKYAWVKPLKDKKGKTILKDFIEIVNKSNRKPRKLYNKLTQELLGNIDILMYSTHSESKSVIAERFIKSIKNES